MSFSLSFLDVLSLRVDATETATTKLNNTIRQGKITAQGKLLLHGQLYCTTELSKLPSKEFKELQVFLFEQAIIFSEIVGKRTQFIQPVFIYKAHIQVISFLVFLCVGSFTISFFFPHR